MEKLLVKGEVQLKGKVRVSGAKNAALPIMAATLLCSGKCILHNVPCLRDIKLIQDVLILLGATVSRRIIR